MTDTHDLIILGYGADGVRPMQAFKRRVEAPPGCRLD